MTRRVLIRLILAAAGLVALAVAALVAVVFATAAPELPPLPLPTATAQPNPGLFYNQFQTRIAADHAGAAAQTDLAYEDEAHAWGPAAQCNRHGHWSLNVNPEDVTGRPFPALPSLPDWARAADALRMADALCPSTIVLTWFGHDRAHPASDRWTALLAASVVIGIDGPALRRYALRHARQM